MWQIRKYDSDHFWNKDYHLMDLIKEVESETDDDSIMLIEGQTYRWCAISPENKVIGVKEISFNTEPDDEEYGDFKCPYCGEVDGDAWELDDNDTIECGFCGSEIEYERHVEVTYTVMPVKPTKIISI